MSKSKSDFPTELVSASVPDCVLLDLYGVSHLEGPTRIIKLAFTVRGDTPQQALERAMQLIHYARDIYQLYPYPPSSAHTAPSAPSASPASPAPSAPSASPASPAPSASSASPTSTPQVPGRFRVEHLLHCVTADGRHQLKVKGGRYVKYGLVAWVESLPQPYVATFSDWPLGEVKIPADMTFAVPALDSKKVDHFEEV